MDRARAEGIAARRVHLTFLSPLEPGLSEIFRRFRKVDDGRDQLQRRVERSIHHE